ncbi:MAG: inorganic diphosphatase [Candidatus Pacebacteria bacterium]|jgi:inorganic pyrophosphatase|nr:inorganic diphosphatase [Candidatus Paceibacterota bacterium]NMB47691.1 inorganic diphosphatase [Patescibacteria group bacterium]MDD2796513.1 inorganic diphosphatase [Candidatus Paceibacterota bacterium]MDD3047952.1 inorganic diphosphatase [Candidatus Paceibacterota bacterium]MDD3510107.1 inorganic diphosphatase [Candidatus Paceibacterota bacterium]
MEIKIFIEIPKGSRQKYELNEETGQIELDRTIYGPVYFPFEYGYIKNTLADDGDPLDALILTNEATFPGCTVLARIIGMLVMEDESGIDNKILAVPVSKINPAYSHINDISDLTDYEKNLIKEFFEVYKRMEPNKWVKVEGFADKERAIKEVEKTKNNYEKI